MYCHNRDLLYLPRFIYRPLVLSSPHRHYSCENELNDETAMKIAGLINEASRYCSGNV